METWVFLLKYNFSGCWHFFVDRQTFATADFTHVSNYVVVYFE